MAELIQNPKLSVNAINYSLINYELNILNVLIPKLRDIQFEFDNIVGGYIKHDTYNKQSLYNMDHILLSTYEDIKNILNAITNLTLELNSDDLRDIEQLLSSSSIAYLPKILNEIKLLLTRIDNKTTELCNTFKQFDWLLDEDTNKTESSIVYEISDLSVLRNEAILTFKEEKNKLEITLEIIDNQIKKNKQDKSLHNNFVIKLNEEKDLLIKSFDNKISKVSEQHFNNYKNFQLDLEKSYDSLKAANQTIENLIQRNTDLRSEITGYKRKIQEIADNRDNEIKEILLQKLFDLENTANKKIAVIDQSYENAQINHERFKGLVEQAGIYNLIVNYKQKAEDENIEYKRFRRYTNRAIYWAIGTAIVMFLISLFEIYFSNKDTDLLFFIYRMTISLMFFVLAFYSSKQAAKHYECFQENNRTYLQLAALEPFMERMSEDEKKEIRKTLIPTYFNQNADDKFSPHGEEIGLPSSLSDSVEKIAEILKSWKGSDSSKPN